MVLNLNRHRKLISMVVASILLMTIAFPLFALEIPDGYPNSKYDVDPIEHYDNNNNKHWPELACFWVDADDLNIDGSPITLMVDGDVNHSIKVTTKRYGETTGIAFWEAKGLTVKHFVVKGGDNFNDYDYEKDGRGLTEDGNLFAPIKKNIPQIGHITIYYF